MQKGQSYLFTHFSISASSLSPSQRLSLASRQLAHPEQTGQETEEKGSRKEKNPEQAGQRHRSTGLIQEHPLTLISYLIPFDLLATLCSLQNEQCTFTIPASSWPIEAASRCDVFEIS